MDDKKLLHVSAIQSGPLPTLPRLLGAFLLQKIQMDFNSSTVSHRPAGAKAEALLDGIMRYITPVNIGWLLLGFVVLFQLYKPRKSVSCNLQRQLNALRN